LQFRFQRMRYTLLQEQKKQDNSPMSDQHGSYRINPAFDRFPEEANLIGRILASFGEIEFSICRNAGHAANMPESVSKALYRLRTTSGRIDSADAFMRPAFAMFCLSDEYAIAHSAVLRCLKIRNQFAHCNWADSGEVSGGLFFADLREAAEGTEAGFDPVFKHVDVPLLNRQYGFFSYTMEWLSFLDVELGRRTGRLNLAWPKPLERELPPLHNPPENHLPPWLDENLKALHLARALAAKGGAPTPTPAQQALDRAREEKKAKRKDHRERSSTKRSDK
jgi:hypothetical protein